MKWTLRILGGFVLLVVVLVVGLFAVARIHDGPLEGGLAIVAAGAFKSGDLQSDPEEPDWSFLRDYSTVEFQLLDPVRSRTTWIMEHEGRIFIPSGYMNSIGGKIWKRKRTVVRSYEWTASCTNASWCGSARETSCPPYLLNWGGSTCPEVISPWSR